MSKDVCPWCAGSGEADSGGSRADGSWINIECPYCSGTGLKPDVCPECKGEGGRVEFGEEGNDFWFPCRVCSGWGEC